MADVEVWCRLTLFDEQGEPAVSLTLAGHGHPDLAVVDTILRLQFLARRSGRKLVATELSPDLAGLFVLVGLGRQVSRQPEEREESLGIEKGVELGDPPS